MHELTRGDGWTTTISVAKPDASADERKETTDTSQPNIGGGGTAELPE